MIGESAENYLEAILILEKSGPVRAVDVARRLGFARPTVSVMLHELEKSGHIRIADGLLSLLPPGREVAAGIYDRHETIARLLMAAGVGSETAYIDACKIEHDLSAETFARLKEYAARLPDGEGRPTE